MSKSKSKPKSLVLKIAFRGREFSRLPTLGVSVVSALILGAGACGNADDADEFRAGIPQREDIAMLVPGGSATQSALTASGGVTKVQAALAGERAESYVTTREITGMVNGATGAVLDLVKTITEFPPTSVGTDVAVWGPHTETLKQNTWRLTVNRVGSGMFRYSFDAKPRATDDSHYLTVLSGQHIVANPGTRRRASLPAYGSGDFVLDWDNARQLPEHDENVGKARFSYSRPAPIADVNIAATFTNVRDEETGMLVNAQYEYLATPGQGGSFQFTLVKNAITTTAALETMSVRSRWQENGAGRADLKVAGGDVAAADATGNECWGSGDLGFLSAYQTNSYGDASKMWGTESACVFPTADYAVF